MGFPKSGPFASSPMAGAADKQQRTTAAEDICQKTEFSSRMVLRPRAWNMWKKATH